MEFSWLDFSEKDRKRVLHVLDTLKEPNAVDELGVGIIRDYFAEKFFPGISTLQTRAKYFVLSAYIFKDLEKNNFKNYTQYLEELDRIEEICARNLLSNKTNNERGIIGWRNLKGKKKKWVKRGPADIYWNGIKRYGIFGNENLTLKGYVKLFVEMKKKNKNLNAYERNRTINEDEVSAEFYTSSNNEIFNLWKVPIKTYNSDWINKLKEDNAITLNKEEAEFLKERIISTQTNTLIGTILKENLEAVIALPRDNDVFDNLGQLIINLNIPEEVKNDYILAKNMADFIYCAQLRYNIIISKDENIEVKNKWKEYAKNMKIIAEKIDLNKILIKDYSLIRFLKRLQEVMLSNKRLEEKEEEIDKIVKEREKFKKRERAKLDNPIETKGNWQGLDKLTYRAKDALRLISDIMEGIKKC